MQFRYLSAHKIQGISQNPDDLDVLLVERSDINMRAILTGDADRHCYLLDRRSALAEMLLIGKLDDENFDEVLSTRVEEKRDERRRKLGAAGVLVIEGWGDIEAKLEGPTRDFGEYLIAFDPINPEAIMERYRHVITPLIVSFSIASSESHRLEKVAEGIYLVDEAGKVIHPLFPRLGEGTVYISRPIDQETAEATRVYYSVLTNEGGLERVSSLFAQSMDLQYDDFRRFIFGWSALEILVSKVFRDYERAFVDELVSGARVHGASRYFGRITEVMKDKYSLVDKFGVIAAVLTGEASGADIENFKRIKKIRDNLFHGQDVPETSLPNAELQSLLGKYFRSHLDYVRGT